MSDPDYIRVRADTVTDPLIRRLTDPPFGTETSERNLMAEAARTLLAAWAELDAVRAEAGANFALSEGLAAQLAGAEANTEAAVALAVEQAADGLVNAFLHMRAIYAKEIAVVTPFDPLQAFYKKEEVWPAIGDAKAALAALAPASGFAALAELRADMDGRNREMLSMEQLSLERKCRAEKAEAERDTLAAELSASRAREKGLREVSSAYEAWEADVILAGDWTHATPRLTQDQWDELVRIQGMRNAALAQAPEGDGA